MPSRATSDLIDLFVEDKHSPFDVGCPKCGVGPQVRCDDMNTRKHREVSSWAKARKKSTVHRERVDLWKGVT